jgi:hypothetical protein
VKYAYYVNVGNLPREKAEAYLKEVRKGLKKTFLSKHDVIIVPIKEGDGHTRIEVLSE